MRTFLDRRVVRLLAVTLAIAGGAACSSNSGSPTQPSTGISVASVSFSGTNVAIGGTAQGTVRLSAAAPSTGAIVALSSSNPAAIGVPASATVQGGADSVAFTITGVSAGSATIRATFNGSSAQSVALTATQAVTVLSVTLGSSSVVGGEPIQATVTLTAPAPAEGAVVTLSGGDPISAPPTVTVPAGQVGVTVTVLTRAVGGDIPATLTASYGGGTASASLSVTRPTVARAVFGVTGSTQTETCTLSNDGKTLDCVFDGSESSAPGKITSWEWTYGAITSRTETTTTPVLDKPAFDCSLIPPAPLPAGTGWLTMAVSLKVRDELGNVSAAATHGDVRILPQGSCGY